MTTVGPGLKAELLGAIPSLRAFAMSLSGNIDRADDLVQETLVKAWSNLGSFTEGTNMSAWLFTILRNNFYSQYRKRRREVADSDGMIAARLASGPSQHSHMDFLDFKDALQQLSRVQREALILVGASGMSYEQAAEICGCAVGTMKSRVNRARNRLASLLDMGANEMSGAEAQWQSQIEPVTSRSTIARVGG
jgi:RNA polymerase sigma-70 factor (ECF subfamily)